MLKILLPGVTKQPIVGDGASSGEGTRQGPNEMESTIGPTEPHHRIKRCVHPAGLTDLTSFFHLPSNVEPFPLVLQLSALLLDPR